MVRLGIEVQLVCFFDDLEGKRPTADDQASVLRFVRDLKAFPIRKGRYQTLKRLPHILHTPWHVVCRSLGADAQQQLEDAIRVFNPDLLWCEGPWCGVVARGAADRLSLPLVYRSHNIEHLYMARQAAVARNIRDRLAWTVACFGLERFERDMLARADWVFDISQDDLAFWQARGVQRNSWLPPLAESALLLAPAVAVAPIHDVVFLGNLTTPNNVRGVEWLVQEIRPLVLARRPGTRFVIGGSNPGPHVRQVCTAEGVTLMANVADAPALYANARVLVNPVRTGSGTHVKMIEMLMMPAPIVTASQGTKGLPARLKRLFRVADTAEDFAAEVVEALDHPADLSAERAEARRLFGVDGLADALAELPADMKKRHRMPMNGHGPLPP